MEFDTFKKEFKDYLSTQDKKNNSERLKIIQPKKKYDLNNKEISIFSYTDELNKFLSTKYEKAAKETSIKKEDILNLEFEDGKFKTDEKKADKKDDKQTDKKTDEKTDEQTDKKADEQNDKNNDKKLPLIDILNDLLKDKKMKSLIDANGDKKIDKDEIKGFIEAIEDLDGKKDEISIEDIIKGTEAIQKKEKKEEADKKTDKNAKNDKTEKTNKPTTNTNPTSSNVTGGGSPAGSGGSYTPTNNGSVSSDPKTNSITQKGETLEDLENLQTEKENELSNAQQAYDDVYTGNNDKVKAAVEQFADLKQKYEDLVKEEKNLTEEQKKKLTDADKKIEDAKADVNTAERELQDVKNEISSQENIVSADEANLSVLKDSLSALKEHKSDDSEKQSEINSKISELNTKIAIAENKLDEDKAKLEELKKKETEAEKTLTEKKDELEKTKEEKTNLEQEFIVNNENISKELKEALKAYNEADKNVETVKESEAAVATNAINKAQNELVEINNKINEKKVEETKKENSVSGSNFDFNFEENLSPEQQYALGIFKTKFFENKDKYDEVSRRTGVPSELIAAIHFRESGGNFGTYLHNGEPLGQVTQHVPAGIYFGKDQWTEAAVDALTRQGVSNINGNDLSSLLDFAERYNGLGYRNRGLTSPYVWAGTTNYHGGRYVADGVFDPNSWDNNPGVAVMMKAVSS